MVALAVSVRAMSGTGTSGLVAVSSVGRMCVISVAAEDFAGARGRAHNDSVRRSNAFRFGG